MSNRFSRGVGALDPFKPKGAIAEGLPEVTRGSGLADDDALFQVGNQLAGMFGQGADDQAKVEGMRAGKIAGNDPAYRPEGSTTLRGVAFEKAAESTYLDNLDATMRSRMMEAYQANKDNPAGLTAAFDKIKADMMANDVFPEIRGPVGASFERLRLPFQVRASDALTENTRDQARAARVTNETERAGWRTSAIEANPNDPRVQQAVRDDLAAQKRLDQELVDSGAITAEQAATRHLARVRDTVTRQAIAAISGIKTIEDMDKAQAAYDAEKKAGKGELFKDPKAIDTVEAALAAQRNKILTEGRRVIGLTDKAADDMVSRAERGTFPSVTERAQLRATASTPEAEAIVARLDRRLDAVAMVDARGPEAADAMARELRRVAGPTPTKAQADDIRYLEDLANERRKQVKTDPILLADRNRSATVEQINTDDPGKLADGVRKRAALSAAMAPNTNPDGRMLQIEEIKRLNRVIEMGGEKAVQTVEALVRGAGRDAPRLMREIGGSAPELSQAGLLMVNGRPQAARELLAGVALRNVEGGAKMREVSQADFGKAFNEIVGAAMVDNPQDQARIKQTAQTIAAYRLRNAADMKGSAAMQVYRDSIQDALGRGTVGGESFGGVARVKPGWWSTYPVVAPPDVRADRFQDVIGAIRDTDLASQPVPPAAGFNAARLRQAVPVAVPGGYRFAMGDPASSDPRFVRGADGAPFVLRWDAVRGELRSRVPGAFEGGR
jgi:hypothetical protein